MAREYSGCNILAGVQIGLSVLPPMRAYSHDISMLFFLHSTLLQIKGFDEDEDRTRKDEALPSSF